MMNFQSDSHAEIRELVLRDPFGISRGTKTSVHNVFVRIGEGWGEGAPIYYHGQSAVDMLELAKKWLSQSHDYTRPIDEIIHELLEQYPGQSGLAQAIDLALHDVRGKREGMPIHTLFGLDSKNNPISSFTIGIDTKEQVFEKVRRAEQYPILKIKGGGDNDLSILTSIREITQKPLWIDANEGWTCEQTLEYLPYLRNLEVRIIEQPLKSNDWEGYARLNRQNPTDIPILIDEAVQGPEDVERWTGIVQGINIKLAKCGGLARAQDMIRIARRCGMLVMLGCMIESSLGITAAAHLSSLADYLDLDGATLLANDPFHGMELDRGRIVMPNKPGIGV